MAELLYKTVSVFCASSTKVSRNYIDTVQVLASELVRNNIGIKYGGGEVGLMGELANCVLSLKGRITGVIPKFMVDVEWQHKDVEDMVLVDTMHQRKSLLIKDVDAVIALPGSTGTLEELIEVLSLKKLGLFTKPVIVVNTNGFYNPLIDLLKKMIDEQFMRPEHLTVCTFVNNLEGIVDLIKNTPEWIYDEKKYASL
ncbi:MAG: TIGR00730 family Rossman fold protein [Marinilabiliaceae bacterium]|nr:TIGR00730 family Rossman fold protein [Marinilabiliaceae bacterium]